MMVEILRDCTCERRAHYLKKSPTFLKGQVFEVESEFINFYGSYYTIKDGEYTFDILRRNAKPIETH